MKKSRRFCWFTAFLYSRSLTDPIFGLWTVAQTTHQYTTQISGNINWEDSLSFTSRMFRSCTCVHTVDRQVQLSIYTHSTPVEVFSAGFRHWITWYQFKVVVLTDAVNTTNPAVGYVQDNNIALWLLWLSPRWLNFHTSDSNRVKLVVVNLYMEQLLA